MIGVGGCLKIASGVGRQRELDGWRVNVRS
jgi:hypothetical protein